jgi:hypothetical protein
MYCPECRVEYRPGFSRCSDCDAPLVSSLPEEAEPVDIEAPAGDVVVFRSDRSLEAEMVGGALEEAGIAYSIRTQLAGGLQLTPVETHWVPGQSRAVLVPTVAADRAREVVEALVLSKEEDEEAPLAPIEPGGAKNPLAKIVASVIVTPILLALLLGVMSVIREIFR